MEKKATATVLTLLTMLLLVPTIQAGENYVKECIPDLGQHSSGWCWVAAASNSFYWFSQHGYPELIDDPTAPGVDQKYVTDTLIPHTDCPTAGYYRLLDEVCKSTWKDSAGDGDGQKDPNEPVYTFCEPVQSAHDYVCGMRAFIAKQSAELWVEEEKWGATFNDFQNSLRKSAVILWLKDYGGPGANHFVTGISFDTTIVPNTVGVSDPWTIDHPDHNNDLDHDPSTYDTWNVVYDVPFVIEPQQDIINGPSHGQDITVGYTISISPLTVGGVVAPIDKFGLLTSYLGLTSTIIVAAVAAALYIKHIKRGNEKQLASFNSSPRFSKSSH